MKFCVIGAGNGGRAFAAYLSAKGYSINLYNRSYSRINDIKKAQGIKSKGELKGFYPIDLVTRDLKLAIKDVDVILVVVPASAHRSIAKKLAPYLAQDQIILLNPGRTFGAVEFRTVIEKERGQFPIFIAETQTLLFTSRQLKKNKVKILKIKNSVDFSAFPEKDNFFIHDTLVDVFPQLNVVDDYLEVTLNNIGMLLHPALSLMNAGSMDGGKEFAFYKEGATKRICEILETIQLELNKIFQKLGLKQVRYCKWAQNSYGIKDKSIYKAIQSIDAYKNIKAPQTLMTRYLTEDVPTGLVPIASLAQYLQIDTPIINSIIKLSSILCGIEFKKKGRTVENLDLIDYLNSRINTVNTFELSDLQNKRIKV